MSKGLKVFITYAHKNSEAKDKLITYLAVMKQNGLIDVWHDNEILPGDKWRDAIFNNLADSDILLYLTCPYSLASENCNKELTAALNPNIRVIPIILEHCDWENHQLSDFQALPEKGKPIYDISEWNPESKGWMSVVKGIRKVIKGIQSKSDLSSATSEKQLHAELSFHFGNILMMFGQLDIAIAEYSKAIDLNSLHIAAFHNRGIAYGKKGKYYLSIEDFTQVIELNPPEDHNTVSAYSNRGASYTGRGEFNKAIKDCTKAIKLNPHAATAYNNRGNAYTDKGKVDKAIKDYHKALQLNPDFADAYCNRGNAYRIKTDFEQAISDCNTAIELDPNHAAAYNNRGSAYAMKSEVDRALEDFNKAIQLDPNLAEVYYNCGVACLNKKDFNQAIVNFNMACELKSDYAEAYTNLGLTWLQMQAWEYFKSDMTAARNIGVDITVGFRNAFGSIENFEQITGIQLPEDIAALLTPPQA